jgi:hypothetical protein
LPPPHASTRTIPLLRCCLQHPHPPWPCRRPPLQTRWCAAEPRKLQLMLVMVLAQRLEMRARPPCSPATAPLLYSHPRPSPRLPLPPRRRRPRLLLQVLLPLLLLLLRGAQQLALTLVGEVCSCAWSAGPGRCATRSTPAATCVTSRPPHMSSHSTAHADAQGAPCLQTRPGASASPESHTKRRAKRTCATSRRRPTAPLLAEQGRREAAPTCRAKA